MSYSRACFFGVFALGLLLVCAPALLTVSTRILHRGKNSFFFKFIITNFALNLSLWCRVLCAHAGGCWVGSRRGGVAKPHGQAGRQRAPAVLRQVLPPLRPRPPGSGPAATLPPRPPPHRPQQPRLWVPLPPQWHSSHRHPPTLQGAAMAAAPPTDFSHLRRTRGHARHNTQHTTHNAQHTTHNTQHTTHALHTARAREGRMLRKALGAVKRAVKGVAGVPDLFFAELSSEKGKQSFKDVRPPAAAAGNAHLSLSLSLGVLRVACCVLRVACCVYLSPPHMHIWCGQPVPPLIRGPTRCAFRTRPCCSTCRTRPTAK
jgi:hypothetical protein